MKCKINFDPDYVLDHELIRRITVKGNSPRFPFHNGDLLAFQQPSDNWSTTPRDKGVHWSPSSFPNTLSEFRQWWTDLGEQAYEVDFPRKVGGKGGGISAGNNEIGELRETEVGNDEPAKPAGRFPVVFLTDDKTGNFRYDSVDSNKTTQIFNYEIPVTEVSHVKISQQSIGRKFQNLASGKFEDSFRDLQAAALSYQNVQLTRLESFLHHDASKGSDVFEALGVKFPADQITVWGIIVLLAIQLYYFARLKSVADGSATDPDARLVPWIGTDRNVLSRCILFVTTVLIPVAAIGLLIWKKVPAARFPDQLHSFWTFAGAGYSVVLIVSIVLALGSWVYRPKLYPATEEYQISDEVRIAVAGQHINK